ncbi:MAG: efflux RND transporter periplasmic adaptor subunit [Planctomycetota bacterium]|nr:MAG: efflux RND transporter periplasmic adaptor subunit [Planctomycetota bacterium]
MQFTHWQPVSLRGLRQRSFLLAVSVSLVLLGMVSGCNRPSAASPEQAAAPKTPEVKVVRPEKKDIRRPIERPGYNIEAYERTLVYAKIPGYVQKWNFDMGDRVHKDDILAELYIPEMEVELKQKEASIAQAASEIKQADAGVVRARADLVRAKSQYDLDKEQVDETGLAFETAQAAVAKAQADVDVAKARLEVAKADRDHVQTLLQYTKIPAPFDGVVTRRNVNTRDFVQPAAASKGDALFVVEKVDPVRVFVNVQELEAVWVRDGDTALIRPQSLQGQQFKGKVTRTSGSLNPQNRTLRTEIDLPNAEGKLLPGMYVTATIIAEHKNIWALPVAAVVTQGEQTFCYRVESSKTVRTPIQVGLRGSERVEVLAKQTKPAKAGEEAKWEDFNGDEVIVASDPGSLTDGQAISISTGKSQ